MSVLVAALRQTSTAKAQEAGERRLTAVELAERLQVGEAFIRGRMRPGYEEWPSHRVGDRISFTPADVGEIEAQTWIPARTRRPGGR